MHVGEVCWWKLFCMLVKIPTYNFINILTNILYHQHTFHQHHDALRSACSWKVLTNIQVFCQQTFFTNIVHQHWNSRIKPYLGIHGFFYFVLMDEFDLFCELGLQPYDHLISSEPWEHVLIALNFSLFDFRFIINPFRNNRRKQNWSWSKKQLKGVTLNSFKRSSSFDYFQGYYHFSDVIIMTSLPLQNWQQLENLQPFFSCWMLKNWICYHMEKRIVRKLKLLIWNQLCRIRIFQSHYSVNQR